MFETGEIVQLGRHCRAWTGASGGLKLHLDELRRGDLVVVLGRHDAASDLRMMTMVEILHRDVVLIVDQQHLQACNRSEAVV